MNTTLMPRWARCSRITVAPVSISGADEASYSKATSTIRSAGRASTSSPAWMFACGWYTAFENIEPAKSGNSSEMIRTADISLRMTGVSSMARTGRCAARTSGSIRQPAQALGHRHLGRQGVDVAGHDSRPARHRHHRFRGEHAAQAGQRPDAFHPLLVFGRHGDRLDRAHGFQPSRQFGVFEVVRQRRMRGGRFARRFRLPRFGRFFQPLGHRIRTQKFVQVRRGQGGFFFDGRFRVGGFAFGVRQPVRQFFLAARRHHRFGSAVKGGRSGGYGDIAGGIWKRKVGRGIGWKFPVGAERGGSRRRRRRGDRPVERLGRRENFPGRCSALDAGAARRPGSVSPVPPIRLLVVARLVGPVPRGLPAGLGETAWEESPPARKRCCPSNPESRPAVPCRPVRWHRTDIASNPGFPDWVQSSPASPIRRPAGRPVRFRAVFARARECPRARSRSARPVPARRREAETPGRIDPRRRIRHREPFRGSWKASRAIRRARPVRVPVRAAGWT